MHPAVEQGDVAYAGRAWAAAVIAYLAAARSEPLPAAVLERLGLAAFLVGDDDESDRAREQAWTAYLAEGDLESAVRVGHWLAVTLVLRGEHARAGGWFARLRDVLAAPELRDSVWHLYVRLSDAMMLLFGGDAVGAITVFTSILAGAQDHDEPDLDVLVRNGFGQALVTVGQVGAGIARLDEAMLTATTDERVSPQVVGLIYCAVIAACRRVFDLRRAQEWTGVLSRWCASQPDLVPYRGQCLVHRAEILALHGLWPDAGEEVDRVFQQLGEEPTDVAAGMAHYQRGELYRLRGEVAQAEASYRRASRCGHDPQPGLALLRLATGDVQPAYAALQRAVAETAWPQDRLRFLPALIDVALAAGDIATARAAAEDLSSAAAEQDAPMLAAAAAQAGGQVALATGDAGTAVRLLRTSLKSWQALGAPHDAAVTRLHLAAACREMGDDDTADLELDAARWTFEQLGAAPDLARAELLARPTVAQPPTTTLSVSKPSAAGGSLTPRESQVLRLVATGRTNRDIAHDLFLSEKTVARHVANIFLKLAVSSRSAATAYAYEHRLV